MISGDSIPKYVSQLYIPPIYKPLCKYDANEKRYYNLYDIDIKKIMVQMLPKGFPKTLCYGYGGNVYSKNNINSEYCISTPGPTFLTKQGTPIYVRWNNKIYNENILGVDPTLHWANPWGMTMNHDDSGEKMKWPPYPPGFPCAQFPVPVVTHLHGAETEPIYDGMPEAWFTFNDKIVGPAYKTNVYEYLNYQQPTTLFYHDHALGITRLNIYSGLLGAYLIQATEKSEFYKEYSELPSGKYDIPLILGSNSFNEDGSLYFDYNGINPSIHPYWRPLFLGNTNMVNGRVWPNLNVENRAYRFRIVNGALDRIYTLSLSNKQQMIQIATDGGYLEKPVLIDKLSIAPAERADIIIDFSKAKICDEIILLNENVDIHEVDTVGNVMRFKVMNDSCSKCFKLPSRLNNIPKLRENISKRIVTLTEVDNSEGIVAHLLDGQLWSAPVTENPIVGSTQIWEIVNLTKGSHPIHLHLIDFQIVNRQEFNKDEYQKDWENINGKQPFKGKTKVIDPGAYLIGDPILPQENERGWKDTVLAYPNEVTRIIVPIYPNTVDPCNVKLGENLFPFDPTGSPGYVWHCHILSHEDNEMMRPMKISALSEALNEC